MNKLAELKAVADQVRSEIKVNENGEGSLSIRALARICDVHYTTLLVYFGGGNSSSKLAQKLTSYGFDTGGKTCGCRSLRVSALK